MESSEKTRSLSIFLILSIFIILVTSSSPPSSAYARARSSKQSEDSVSGKTTLTRFEGPIYSQERLFEQESQLNLEDVSTPALPSQSTTYGPQIFPEGINPLTGMKVEDPSLLERRPIAIKITNYPRYVRPQSGLSLADNIYEYYLERGITRFIAIYYGNDASKVGPVRSGRFFDEHIFRMYQSYFVFGSADDRVMDYFLTLGQSIVNRFVLEQPDDRKQTCQSSIPTPLCRDRNIVSYNNMFANTQALTQYLSERRSDNSRQDLTGMLFGDHLSPGETAGTQIDISYSRYINNRWIFDPNSDHYLRFEEAKNENPSSEQDFLPLFDKLTGEIIDADNVVILYVPHRYYAKSPTDEVIQIDLTASGQAYLFRDGYVYAGLWVRPSDGGVLQLLGLNGEPLPLKPGVTFFEVVGRTTSLSIDGERWGYAFNIP